MPQTRIVPVLVGPEYEDLEVWYPKLRLEEAGFHAPLIGNGDAHYRGKHGYPCTVDGHVRDLDPSPLAGIVVPGGWAPDKLRRDPAVLALVRGVYEAGGIVASICHGPWILISAGLVRGRRLTGSLGIKDDLENAGAIWVDEPAVVDDRLVSARVPKDLPAFMQHLLAALAAR
ncbi:MAG: type 1 glutamine amidotransferase domain-containing protein [Gemmatimonas sp.]|jgi:protease I|uniref:type 1 glutamine amidotransferase domain-containing protein n=1 Tax=Gemmatimonas sp. TaxID=1962908 RepID=UPI00391EFF63|nr:type 1 glutamine amidotransferase [Gemmatimonadota bacterium]